MRTASNIEQSKILIFFDSTIGNVKKMTVLVPDSEMHVRSVEVAKVSDVE